MRTTVSIPEGLLKAAKARAIREGITLSDVVVAGLRATLRPARAEAFRMPTVSGNGPRRGVPLDSNAALEDFMDAADQRNLA